MKIVYTKKTKYSEPQETNYQYEVAGKGNNKVITIKKDDREPRTFKIGDVVMYDGWNLIYTGNIMNIGDKTVTVKDDTTSRIKRLNIYEFCYKNFYLDLEHIKKENTNTMYTL